LATSPLGTATPYLARISFAWYSCIFTFGDRQLRCRIGGFGTGPGGRRASKTVPAVSKYYLARQRRGKFPNQDSADYSHNLTEVLFTTFTIFKGLRLIWLNTENSIKHRMNHYACIHAYSIRNNRRWPFMCPLVSLE